jgi:sugar lactone lactonase YvrE
VLTEEAGNQFQWVSAEGELSAFLGFDGSTFGLHTAPNASADGCPATAPGSSPDGFWRPRGVMASDGQSLYVSDTGQGRILRLAPTGTSPEAIASGLDGPVLLGLFDGRLLVGTATDEVLWVDPETGATETLAGPGTGDGQVALGIASGATPAAIRSGTTLYLVEPANHRVQRFVDGVPAGWIGAGHVDGFASGGSPAPGTANGEFTGPVGIAIDLAGTLWVADGATGGRLQRFDRDGRHLRSRYLAPKRPPGGILVDRYNRLWFTLPDLHQARSLGL